MKRRRFLSNISLAVGGTSIWSAPVGIAGTPVQEAGADKPLTGIRVTVPSTVQVNEAFWVGIRMVTVPFYAEWIPIWQRTRATVNGPFNKSSRGIRYMENVVPVWKEEVTISGGEGYEGPSRFSFKNGAGPYEADERPVRRLEGFRFTTPGIHYIRVADPVSGIVGVSNPIRVTSDQSEERLFWGNLHCHSIFGDGVRLPEEIYAFARDESFLDVFALTDHTEAITNAQWTYFKEVANDFNQPGRFVTFVGGEWTSTKFGHRNFIYRGPDGPIIRSSAPDQDDLEKLYAIARSQQALIIANHTASPGHTTKWENGHDPEVERLVEVYSIGGVNEMPASEANTVASRAKIGEIKGSHVVDALKKGFRLGMIGTGDDHDGRPGDSLHNLQEEPEGYKHLLGPGLMGVWAADLTREAVFDALWNRRVYGTTNNRTLLKFAVNGNPMGSELTGSGRLRFHVEAASNGLIRRIDLIADGKPAAFLEPDQLQAEWRFEEAWPVGFHWYYVRLTLEDDHLAWSSPIWINHAE